MAKRAKKEKVPDCTEVLPPAPSTLKRYGLSMEEWKAILARQDGRCAVCKLVPKKGRLCIDHDHAKGWKKMSNDDRKKYVRGLLCWRCNTTYVGRGASIERALATAAYLTAYQDRNGSVV